MMPDNLTDILRERTHIQQKSPAYNFYQQRVEQRLPGYYGNLENAIYDLQSYQKGSNVCAGGLTNSIELSEESGPNTRMSLGL
eukprot:CAMPEP_0194446734 /NCGR_PEP_ID=MMETSP0176-20130528/128610_1 /TAXON_ID=216777 /ORGANISM="Proboscia alata, Strain PI-D3" /LENGTH=82 /DNA_ID=CAMNT_0039273493 /DNA_START=539 /DNA_END=788 /DNA_ORIENTATION=+